MNAAYISQNLNGIGSEVRILPSGLFRAKDGRPEGIAGWRLTSANAGKVISATLASGNDVLIDYEHQSIHTQKNGKPAPAAGWFNQLVWRDGAGMFAVNVRWTDKAKEMIAAQEYRYISPVFSYDNTGNVLVIHSVAVTNTPALPMLEDLSRVAINSAKPTSPGGAGSSELCNQRGMELLQRMAASVPAPSTSPLAKLDQRLKALNKRIYGHS